MDWIMCRRCKKPKAVFTPPEDVKAPVDDVKVPVDNTDVVVTFDPNKNDVYHANDEAPPPYPGEPACSPAEPSPFENPKEQLVA